MTLWEISLIGLGLSMDALAVSITDGMCYCTQPLHRKLAIPAFIGFFQGLMPLLGYLTGGLFRDFMSRYAGIIMFVIFAVIGLKMGRTEDAVRAKASEADVSLKPTNQSPYNRRKP